MTMMEAIVFTIGLVAFLFWLSQLLVVVKMHDSDFPDRNDKLMWFLLIFLGSLPGAILFLLCRYDFTNVKLREKEQKLEEELHEVTKQKA